MAYVITNLLIRTRKLLTMYVLCIEHLQAYYTVRQRMAFCKMTASQLLKLIIVVCMAITLINGDRRSLQDLTSAADITVRMTPHRRL